METFGKLAIVALLLVAVLGNQVMVANAQTLCNMTGAGLMACKSSVSGPSPPPPSAVCCSALSHADFHCLCSYKNSKLFPSLGIDPKLAMQLPAKCNLTQPTQC